MLHNQLNNNRSHNLLPLQNKATGSIKIRNVYIMNECIIFVKWLLALGMPIQMVDIEFLAVCCVHLYILLIVNNRIKFRMHYGWLYVPVSSHVCFFCHASRTAVISLNILIHFGIKSLWRN